MSQNNLKKNYQTNTCFKIMSKVVLIIMSPKLYVVDDYGFKFFKIFKTIIGDYDFNHLKKIVLTNSGFNFKHKTVNNNYYFNCFKKKFIIVINYGFCNIVF